MNDDELLSRAMALLSARRRRYTGHCAICHAPMRGLATRRTCSNRCRQALKVQRQRTAARARGPQEA